MMLFYTPESMFVRYRPTHLLPQQGTKQGSPHAQRQLVRDLCQAELLEEGEEQGGARDQEEHPGCEHVVMGTG